MHEKGLPSSKGILMNNYKNRFKLTELAEMIGKTKRQLLLAITRKELNAVRSGRDYEVTKMEALRYCGLSDESYEIQTESKGGTECKGCDDLDNQYKKLFESLALQLQSIAEFLNVQVKSIRFSPPHK